MLKRSADLIKEKEKTGARISVYGKISVLLVILIVQFLSMHDHAELIHISVMLLPCIIILAVAAYYLSNNRGITAAGYLSLAADMVIIIIIPFIWYSRDIASVQPRSYLLKTALPLIVFSFMVVNTMALKPVYPLILSVFSSCYMTGLFIYTMDDPRVTFTDDISTTILGPPVNTLFYFSSVIVVAVCGLILSYIAFSARKTIIKSARDEVRNSQLLRYFSPGVAGILMKEDSELMSLGGKRKDAAVMFSDIRNFTSLCESHAAEEILKLLSEYHRFMVPIIFEYGGTLDKFIGDGIMATFGIPESSDNDACNAVLASLKMRKALSDFNRLRAEHGMFTIDHGIGIHYGPVISGNIGSEERLEYTVIGDTVNMASRIESSCKTVHEDILVSKEIAAFLGDAFKLCEYRDIQFKGKTGEFTLYGVSEI